MTEDKRTVAFEAIYQLAAERAGGVLLADISKKAKDTFRKSLIGEAYPLFGFEVPLLGKAGFDLHVYYDRGQIRPDERFAEGCGFGMQEFFDWFFGDDVGGVGIGFAHDLQGSTLATGVYINFNHKPLRDLRGFFTSIGRHVAYEWTQELMDHIPEGWRPWYIGSFSGRTGVPVRVGSFVDAARQKLYAASSRVIADDLAHAGFYAVDGKMLERLSQLAALPYQLDFQIDVNESGVQDTLGVSLTLNMRSADSVRKAFSAGAEAARSLQLLEDWGIADERWHLIPKASMSQIIPCTDDKGAMLLASLPIFVKAKWHASKLQQPAKVYCVCHTRPV